MYEFDEDDQPETANPGAQWRERAAAAGSVGWKGACVVGRVVRDNMIPQLGLVLGKVCLALLQNMDASVGKKKDNGEYELVGETHTGGDAIYQNTKTGDFYYGGPL